MERLAFGLKERMNWGRKAAGPNMWYPLTLNK